jgi:hypothetical protein
LRQIAFSLCISKFFNPAFLPGRTNEFSAKKDFFSSKVCKKRSALAGSRTRVYCLEGNNANRYTTNACKFKLFFPIYSSNFHVCTTETNELSTNKIFLKVCKKGSALAGSRTRVYCLEGNNANRYTTNAWNFDLFLPIYKSISPRRLYQVGLL